MLAAFLAVFFLANVLTAERTPAVWCDEVMYADPGVNLYQGRGFTSGAWFLQSDDKFWAGNVPLYQFVLFGWLKVFGFSVTTVRSLHFTLVTLAGLVAYVSIRRLGLIQGAYPRLLLIVLSLLSSSATFVFRFARPESLAMLLVSLALFCFSLRSHWIAAILLVLLGALLAWNGLQFVAYTFVLSFLLLFIVPPGRRPDLVFPFAGCLLGCFLLMVFYKSHGVWDDFVACVRHFTVANRGTTFANTHAYGSGLAQKLRQIPALYLDLSFVPVMALSLWMFWDSWRSHRLKLRSPLVFGVAAGLFVPLGLHAVGVFPLYYCWMAFFPLALGCCAQLGAWMSGTDGAGFRKFCALGLLLLACLAGLPRRLTAAACAWDARSYDPVMRLASGYVPREAFVFCDFSAYYAAKQNAARVILPNCVAVLGNAEKSTITVAIIRSGDESTLSRDLGGRWRYTGSCLSNRPESALPGLREQLDSSQYNLRVFVRDRAQN